MVPYIINDLGAPTAFFGIAAVVAAFIGLLVQRRWGRYGDERGARAVLFLGGIAVTFPPILWALVPFTGSACWSIPSPPPGGRATSSA
ncbi:MAG: hypothetical protein ACRDJW_08135 [Thermomicrobiales bacterium]